MFSSWYMVAFKSQGAFKVAFKSQGAFSMEREK